MKNKKQPETPKKRGRGQPRKVLNKDIVKRKIIRQVEFSGLSTPDLIEIMSEIMQKLELLNSMQKGPIKNYKTRNTLDGLTLLEL